jgi:hypothetical protein
MVDDIDLNDIAFYDRQRKGIYIHARQLANSHFAPGDRFALHPKPAQLFAVTIRKADDGDILFDKHGIFIERTRHIDILMGGIFEKYVIYLEADEPGTIKLRPLDVVLDTSQKWH